MKSKHRERYGVTATQPVEPLGRGAVVASTAPVERTVPTGAAWRERCHATARGLERAASDAQVSALTDTLGHAPTILDAVERAERYAAAAAVVRRWSGLPG